jgi:hypothetical protein
MSDAKAVRRAIATQTCPWCGRGPWKSLAHHTQRAHGVTAWELREMAGWSDRHRPVPTCSPESSDRYREAGDVQRQKGLTRSQADREARAESIVARFRAGEASDYELAEEEGITSKAMRNFLRRKGCEVPDRRPYEANTEAGKERRRRASRAARAAKERRLPPRVEGRG